MQSKQQKKQTKQNKHRFIDTKNKQVVNRGEEGGEGEIHKWGLRTRNVQL